MSRKRTPKEPTTETSTAVIDAPVVESVAEPPASNLPVAEMAPPEPKPDGQTFVDRVGPKKWTPAPDPFGIAKDNVAGVRLFESKQDRQMAIKFGDGRPEDKPSQAVIDKMKENGFRWNPANRIWTLPVRPDTATATRIDAEKLYQELRQMIRKEKGIETAPEVPF
jgi:hypothetical protein